MAKRLATPTTDDHSVTPTALELHAIKIAGEKPAKAKRDLLVVGTKQVVDVTLRVRGLIDVAADTTGMASSARDAGETLELVLSALSPQMRKKLSAALCDEKHQTAEVDEETKAEAKRLVKVLTRQMPGGKRGAVTGEVAVTLVARDGKRLKAA